MLGRLYAYGINICDIASGRIQGLQRHRRDTRLGRSNGETLLHDGLLPVHHQMGLWRHR